VSEPGAPAPASEPSTPDPRAIGGLSGEWQRLHPLSPFVRAGRGLVAILVLLVIPEASSSHGSLASDLAHLGVLVVFFVLGVISWLVTRWRVEGGVLRVDSGLIRRTSERFPLSQIQAIDTVRPGLARVFGVTELRIRLASGGGKAGRLAYLSNAEAETLRARLLALSRGAGESTPASPPRPQQRLVNVAPGRLFASILLSGAGLVLELAIVTLLVLAVLAPALASAAISAGAVGLFGLAVSLFRRFNGNYRLTVADAADGLQLRSGLVETSAETVPRGRIQAIRMVEPLAWRPFGWCRLEVDVASQKSKGRQDRNQAKSARALLPVGSRQQAALLLGTVFPGLPEQRLAPPARARWKSPLRFRHLAWGANERYAVTSSGRLQRVTDWVPLTKVQSIRLVEGPIQRRLRLSSVHLDTAGRRVHAVLRDRDRGEGARLLAELPERCRLARRGDAD
jgi:putative membrane protein